MSTSKHIDKICIAAVAVALVITIIFMCGQSLGLSVQSRAVKYESTLFDTSYVHKIDIVMDDWDSFIETCENEEYGNCTAVIGFSFLIVVEFQLEAVALTAGLLDGGKRGVSFGAYCDIRLLFAVDYGRTAAVFLVFAILNEGVPVVHNYINLMDIRGVKQSALIFHRF